jgi:hypothetical protein
VCSSLILTHFFVVIETEFSPKSLHEGSVVLERHFSILSPHSSLPVITYLSPPLGCGTFLTRQMSVYEHGRDFWTVGFKYLLHLGILLSFHIHISLPKLFSG